MASPPWGEAVRQRLTDEGQTFPFLPRIQLHRNIPLQTVMHNTLWIIAERIGDPLIRHLWWHLPPEGKALLIRATLQWHRKRHARPRGRLFLYLKLWWRFICDKRSRFYHNPRSCFAVSRNRPWYPRWRWRTYSATSAGFGRASSRSCADNPAPRRSLSASSAEYRRNRGWRAV